MKPILIVSAACALALKTSCVNALSLVDFETNDNSVETIEITGQSFSTVVEQTFSGHGNTAPDMRQQFSQLPGLHINNNGPISGILQYRGLFGDRVPVHINGAEMNGAGPNGMDPPISHIISVPFQKVTVYRGVAPVSVGAEVLGGSVSVDDVPIDVMPSNRWTTEGALSLNRASYGMKSIGGSLYGSNNDVYLGISGDRQAGDNFNSGDARVVSSTFYQRQALQLRTGLDIGSHRVDALFAHRDTKAAGTPALNMDILFIDANWFRLSHTYKSDNVWQLQSQLFGNKNTHDMDNYSYREAPLPARYRLNETQAKGLGLQTKLTLDWTNYKTVIGIDHQANRNYSYISNPNNALFYINNFNSTHKTRSSMFAEQSGSLLDGEITLGVRTTSIHYDSAPIGTSLSMMNPHIASLQSAFNDSDRNIKFSLTDVTSHWHSLIIDRWSVQVSTGIKQRAPSYSQLYTWFPLGISGGLADGNNYIGNLSLKPETAKTIDLGVEYQNTNQALSLNVFFTRINDYITGQPSDVPAANVIAVMNGIALPLQWQNTQAILKGFEVTVRYDFLEQWQLIGMAEYVRGIQLGQSDKNLYRIAPITTRWYLQYQSPQWQYRLAVQYTASQKQVATLQNESISDSYMVADMSFRYFVTPHLQVDASINNLFDTYYSDHLNSVNRVTGSDIAVGERLPNPGRSLGLSIMYQF
jgi:iron complex outermembrane receptor protein